MPRCSACRAQLAQTSRRRSMLDETCNRVVNPRQGGREGTWEERLAQLQALHGRLRGERPGWGQYAAYDLGAMAARPPADYGDAPIFELHPMGRGPRR